MGFTSKENLTGRQVYFSYSSLLVLIVGFTLTNAGVFPCDPPSAEIVSIYNNQFTIPQGFGPYFIKIYRCVDSGMQCPQFTMPNTTNNVTIIVQSNMNGKVYKYTLHNHTSCMCGPQSLFDMKLYESSRQQVFKVANKQKLEKNNPPYIWDCKNPQQRYKKIQDFHSPLFYGYKQCLPMCTKSGTVTSQLSIFTWSGSKATTIQINNDIACLEKQYTVSNKNNNHDNMLNIDSKKTLFALVLLALVFLVAIIIDLTFCCRKKGFCYSLRTCVQDEEETPQDAIQPTLV